MLLGAAWLLWRTRSGWAWGLLGATGVLLILSYLWPAAYAPVNRRLDRLQKGTVQAFSWLVLGLVFLTIFIPGRVVLFLRGKKRVRRNEKRDTYWEVCAAPSTVESFERQF